MKPSYQLQVFCTAGCVNEVTEAILAVRNKTWKDSTTSEEVMGITTLRYLTDPEMDAFTVKSKSKKESSK